MEHGVAPLDRRSQPLTVSQVDPFVSDIVASLAQLAATWAPMNPLAPVTYTRIRRSSPTGVRSDLPTGTVTFLFTDVEGSTKLLHELARGLRGSAGRAPSVAAGSIPRHGGVEVDTQGDAFFSPSPQPRGARAAGEGQAALAEGPIRVRMGLHTGTPQSARRATSAIDVHRARGSPPRATAGRCSFSLATREPAWTPSSPTSVSTGSRTSPSRSASTSSETATSRRSRRSYRANLPDPADAVPRPRARAGRSVELSSPRRATGDADRRRRLRQDAAGARRRRPRLSATTATACGGCRSRRSATAARPPTIAQALGSEGRSARAHRRQAALARARQLRAAARARRALAELLCCLSEPASARHEPGAAARHGEQEYAVPPFVDEEAVGFFLARARAVRPSSSLQRRSPRSVVALDGLPLALELAPLG